MGGRRAPRPAGGRGRSARPAGPARAPRVVARAGPPEDSAAPGAAPGGEAPPASAPSVRSVMAAGLREAKLAPGMGRRVKWGVLTEEVARPGAPPPDPEAPAARELRAAAAAELTNIDAAERGRRGQVGAVALALSAVVAAGLWTVGAPGWLRFALFYPTFATGAGFAASARLGL